MPIFVCRRFGDCRVCHYGHHGAELPDSIKDVNPNHHAKRKYRRQDKSFCQSNNASTSINPQRPPTCHPEHLPSIVALNKSNIRVVIYYVMP
jgi:hypothetical protein